MASETRKAEDTEIPVFLAFIRYSGLPIDPASVEKRLPREPDIRCKTFSGETIAFELVEICDGKMAANRQDCAYIRTSDPSIGIVKNKLNKSRDYETEAPIELLCYTNGRVVSPGSFIAEQLADLLNTTEFRFRRVWLLGRKDEVRLLWPVSK